VTVFSDILLLLDMGHKNKMQNKMQVISVALISLHSLMGQTWRLSYQTENVNLAWNLSKWETLY